jgi:integrase
VKNLVKVEPLNDRQAGATTQTADAKGKVIEYAWWMQNQNYAKSTIRNWTYTLMHLTKQGANLLDPESVKETIAKHKCSDTSKANMIKAYKSFAKHFKITWEPPRYKGTTKDPFIPLEREIDDLIAHCGKKTSTLLQLLKETGMRIGEALKLKWTYIDTEKKIVRVDPEKGSNPRILKLSDKLLGRLDSLRKENEMVFGKSTQNSFQVCFYLARRRAAKKLQNPRLLEIHFHTLRHWKGTMEYHRTQSMKHVKILLGHKSILNTDLYVHLEESLFDSTQDEYHVKTAEKPEEIKSLLETGFEYVCTKDSLMFFKKRK